MKPKSAVAIAIILLSPCAALGDAPKKPPKEWTQEPTSVIGIKLGAPLSESGIPTCPKYVSGSWTPPKDVCVDEDGYSPDKYRKVEGLPWPDIAMTGSVFLLDGKVQSLYLDLRHDDYQRFKEILISRYGPPTETEASPVTSMGGAVVDAETLSWSGKATTIVLVERAGRIDRSVVSFNDNALLEQAHKARQSDIAKEASKF